MIFYRYKSVLIFLVMMIFYPLKSFAYGHYSNNNYHEVGLTISDYRYVEPDLMSLKGLNFGADYAGTFMLDSSWFTRINVLGAYGKFDYSSRDTGSSSDDMSWYIDTRSFFGKSFVSDNFTWSSYVGLGYRYLYHDGRGYSTTNDIGYRRTSNYFYVPVGFEHKIDFIGRSKLVTNVEFDCLLLGKQLSYLSDVHPLNSDLIHWQKFGFGARFDLKYQLDNFFIGPYLVYWLLRDSESVYAFDEQGKLWQFLEPKNYTFELGLKVGFRF